MKRNRGRRTKKIRSGSSKSSSSSSDLLSSKPRKRKFRIRTLEKAKSAKPKKKVKVVEKKTPFEKFSSKKSKKILEEYKSSREFHKGRRKTQSEIEKEKQIALKQYYENGLLKYRERKFSESYEVLKRGYSSLQYSINHIFEFSTDELEEKKKTHASRKKKKKSTMNLIRGGEKGGDGDEEEMDFKNAFEFIKKLSKNIAYILCKVCFTLEYYDECIYFAEKTLLVDPVCSKCFQYSAFSAYQIGDYEKAMTLFEKLLLVIPPPHDTDDISLYINPLAHGLQNQLLDIDDEDYEKKKQKQEEKKAKGDILYVEAIEKLTECTNILGRHESTVNYSSMLIDHYHHTLENLCSREEELIRISNIKKQAPDQTEINTIHHARRAARKKLGGLYFSRASSNELLGGQIHPFFHWNREKAETTTKTEEQEEDIDEEEQEEEDYEKIVSTIIPSQLIESVCDVEKINLAKSDYSKILTFNKSFIQPFIEKAKKYQQSGHLFKSLQTYLTILRIEKDNNLIFTTSNIVSNLFQDLRRRIVILLKNSNNQQQLDHNNNNNIDFFLLQNCIRYLTKGIELRNEVSLFPNETIKNKVLCQMYLQRGKCYQKMLSLINNINVRNPHRNVDEEEAPKPRYKKKSKEEEEEERNNVIEIRRRRMMMSRRELLILEMKNNGLALERISPVKYRRDREIVVSAVSDHGYALKFVMDWKDDIDCKIDRLSEQDLSDLSDRNNNINSDDDSVDDNLVESVEKLKMDRGIVEIAVSNYGKALRFANEQFRNDRGIVTRALENDKDSFMFVGDELIRNSELLTLQKKLLFQYYCAEEEEEEEEESSEEYLRKNILFDYSVAMECTPKNHECFKSRGLFFLSQNRVFEAKHDFESFINLYIRVPEDGSDSIENSSSSSSSSNDELVFAGYDFFERCRGRNKEETEEDILYSKKIYKFLFDLYYYGNQKSEYNEKQQHEEEEVRTTTTTTTTDDTEKYEKCVNLISKYYKDPQMIMMMMRMMDTTTTGNNIFFNNDDDKYHVMLCFMKVYESYSLEKKLEENLRFEEEQQKKKQLLLLQQQQQEQQQEEEEGHGHSKKDEKKKVKGRRSGKSSTSSTPLSSRRSHEESVVGLLSDHLVIHQNNSQQKKKKEDDYVPSLYHLALSQVYDPLEKLNGPFLRTKHEFRKGMRQLMLEFNLTRGIANDSVAFSLFGGDGSDPREKDSDPSASGHPGKSGKKRKKRK